MPIVPLPQFEADLAEYLQEKEDREIYERLSVPTTMVVRFGVMQRVGEFPYSGDVKPGCGSKIVVKTDRGIELGEMLTSTCPNSGCGKSVSRKEMLEYIENSGGRDYPFFDATKKRGGLRDDKPRAIRIATPEDLSKSQALEQSRHELKMRARQEAEAVRLGAKIVDAEPILGEEVLTFYYASEEPVETRALHDRLSAIYPMKIEIYRVGARDEARITADYERCGQHCCCKNFLKVLKPVSMRSAKTQKATLDPLKISGRCGRLMCCLRYEDQTYAELKKRLPHRKTHVGTPEGNGIVIDSQILTQLVLVSLDADNRRVAIPVEDLTEPAEVSQTPAAPTEARSKPSGRSGSRGTGDRSGRDRGDRKSKPKRYGEASATSDPAAPTSREGDRPETGDGPAKKKRRRRRKKPKTDAPTDAQTSGNGGVAGGESGETGKPAISESSEAPAREMTSQDGKPRRRRRRRRGGSGGGGGGSENGPNPSGGGEGGAGGGSGASSPGETPRGDG